MILKASPFVPFKCTVRGDEQKSKHDYENNADLRNLCNVMPQIVNNRGIHVATEANCILLWDE